MPAYCRAADFPTQQPGQGRRSIELERAANEFADAARRREREERREKLAPPLLTATGFRESHESSRVPSRGKTGFNLRGVIEVLVDEGYDPIAEMVSVLKQPEKLEPEVRLRFANELAKYVHAQRKQVDVSAKVELSDEQADARLAQLLALANGITGEDMA